MVSALTYGWSYWWIGRLVCWKREMETFWERKKNGSRNNVYSNEVIKIYIYSCLIHKGRKVFKRLIRKPSHWSNTVACTYWSCNNLFWQGSSNSISPASEDRRAIGILLQNMETCFFTMNYIFYRWNKRNVLHGNESRKRTLKNCKVCTVFLPSTP